MKRKNYTLFVLILSFSCSLGLWAQDSSSNPPKQPPRRSPEAAKAAEVEGQELLFRKHDVRGAIERFKKATELDPWYAHGYLMLGLAYMQDQRWDSAQFAFEDASKVDPEEPQAWLGIGSALNEQKSYEAAQKALTHCLDLKPDSAECHYELARSLLGLQKLEPAEEQAQKAIELNEDYVSPHILMGNIDLAQSNPDDALAEFREALRLEPEGPQAVQVKQTIAGIEKAMKETSRNKKR